MTWERNNTDDKVPTFVYRDTNNQITMQAFVGGSSQPWIKMTNGKCDPATELCINVLLDPDNDDGYAHFCNLEEHITQMQELAAAYRAWDQQTYLQPPCPQPPHNTP